MNTKVNIENINKEILNFNEACKFFDYSKSYLYKLTHLRKIPHYKPNGKKIYFLKEDCEKHLLKNRVKTDLEIQQEAEEKLNQVRSAR